MKWAKGCRQRALTPEMIRRAIEDAAPGPVAEGSVGAGTGTMAFGWKGGIGTSSRVLPKSLGGYTVGVLVQSNFGGVRQILGLAAGQALGRQYLKSALDNADADGSIMMILATDAPLSDRNLSRLTRRALFGLAKTGSSFSQLLLFDSGGRPPALKMHSTHLNRSKRLDHAS